MSGPFDPRLLDAIDRLVIEDWVGIVWRVTVGETDILQANTRGARWNSAGVEALYCSLDRNAAIAEVEHLLSRQSVPVLRQRKVSRLHVKLGKVVELSGEGAAATLGYETTDFVSDDVTIPAHVGAAVEWLGHGGLLVPSVRYAATNLVILIKSQTKTDVIDVMETEAIPPNE
jgi:RES domain-containing protein